LNAGSVMEKKRRMNEPAAANSSSTPALVMDARSATVFASGGRSPVSARNTGMAANGSTIAKTDPKHSTVYVRSSRTRRYLAAIGRQSSSVVVP
jgi:hypothetical protein